MDRATRACCRPLHSLLSCPAKAGHPVITERLVVTGSPAFAGDDDGKLNDPTKNHRALKRVTGKRGSHRRIWLRNSFVRSCWGWLKKASGSLISMIWAGSCREDEGLAYGGHH